MLQISIHLTLTAACLFVVLVLFVAMHAALFLKASGTQKGSGGGLSDVAPWKGHLA